MIDAAKMWWSQIPAAASFLRDAAAKIASENNVILCIPGDCPWKDVMRSEIRGIADSMNPGRVVAMHSPRDMAPGEFVLRTFCPENADMYRPAIGYAKFLADQRDVALNDRIVWVKDPQDVSAWVSFCKDYKKNLKGRRGGVFVIETESAASAKGASFVRYTDYISAFDSFVYALSLVSSSKLDPFLKEYLAELVVNICGTDIEWMQRICCGGYASFLEDPTSEAGLSDDSLVWKAQIKTVFPLTEQFRKWFTDRYYDVIKGFLPFTDNHGDTYSDPKEVELGILQFWNDMRMFRDIEGVEWKDLARLLFVKDVRNDLAHLDPISYERVLKMSDIQNYIG